MKFKQNRKIKNPYIRRELYEMRKREHGHFHLKDELKEAERLAFHEPQLTHKVGELVEYNGDIYRVNDVSSKGVHLQKFKAPDEKSILRITKKVIFVPESKYETATTVEKRFPAMMVTVPFVSEE